MMVYSMVEIEDHVVRVLDFIVGHVHSNACKGAQYIVLYTARPTESLPYAYRYLICNC